MYGIYIIYANIWGILMVNVTIYSIHGSYGFEKHFHLFFPLIHFTCQSAVESELEGSPPES